ncbi:MAG: hypothetical protein AB1Z23_12975 [Eubacteriales bacterium]
MRKKLFIILCIVLSVSAILSGCKRNDRDYDEPKSGESDDREEESNSFFGSKDGDAEIEETEMIEPEETEKLTAEPTAAPVEPTVEPTTNSDEVQSGDIIFTGRESIVFESYVEDATGKTNMKVTMSEGFIRVDIPELDATGVINTNEDTGFVYYKSNFGMVSMSFFNLGSVDSINQLSMICENIDDVKNLERTTLDGRECIYGELEDDGDTLKLWYSQEYHILLQYIMDSSDGISKMKVTSIEEFDGDMKVFDMPDGCIDLGTYDAEGEAFSDIAEDLR